MIAIGLLLSLNPANNTPPHEDALEDFSFLN
jgi:hypothetical protein